jgi:hypothetical protein
MKSYVIALLLLTSGCSMSCQSTTQAAALAPQPPAYGQTIPAAAAEEAVGGMTFSGNSWRGSARGLLVFPVHVHEGCEILQWGVNLYRQVGATSEYKIRIASVKKGIQTPISEITVAPGQNVGDSFVGSAISERIASDRGYIITASRSDGGPDDLVHDAWIQRRCP